MESKMITIDFETSDPYISRKLGAGWVYGLNVEGHDFDVLGASIRTHDGVTQYYTDFGQIAKIASGASGYIMHNASYDLGCLKFLGVDITGKIIYDTRIMARLVDSRLMSYSLDGLSKHFLRLDKGTDGLANMVFDHDLYPWLKRELAAKAKAEKNGEEYVRERPCEKKLIRFAYENMKLLQEVDPAGMATYANLDVELTYKLYKSFLKVGQAEKFAEYSGVAIVLVECRARGVDIDLDKAREAQAELIKEEVELARVAYEDAGEEFNLFSSKDMPRIFDKKGIKYPLTAKGNPSITTPWLEKQSHIPFCDKIIQARRVKKIRRDFIEKILTIQEFTCPGAKRWGKVYPELNLLHARTGRFSSTNPNIQQIPARHPVYSKICRGIICAPPGSGKKLYSLDYSNQEGRIQLHYAYRLKCDGAEEMVDQMIEDPKLDVHQKVADLAGITRSDAKVVNLGVSYGMGLKSLAKLLKKSEGEASFILEEYHDLVPYLKQLSNKCSKVLQNKGYLKTLGGRTLRLEKGATWDDGRPRTFHHLGLNKLVQGSAADQIIRAMIQGHDAGLEILFPVHDQLVMIGDDAAAKKMHDIMRDCYRLSVPMVVDYEPKGGGTWADAGH